MQESTDVLIIGGGVIGLTTAYELSRRGASVTLLERGEPGRESSWAGAGIIAPGNPSRAVAPFDRLRAESAARFPSLAAELLDATGIDVGYRRGGFEYGDVSTYLAEGIVAEPCDQSEIRRREPLARPQSPGYFLPEVAQVRNPRHVEALVAACLQFAVRIYPNSEVTGWDHNSDRIVAIRTPQDQHTAGEYLVCAGAWSEQLLGPIGVRPLRGQMLLYADAEGPRFLHEVGKRYFVPRGDGHVLVGSTEEDAGFVKETTAEGLAGLQAFAEQWFPESSWRLVRSWAGLRPGTPDGLPILGRVPGYRNLSVATGHLRTGIQNSPATARALSELLTQQDPFIPLTAFSPGRFASRQ